MRTATNGQTNNRKVELQTLRAARLWAMSWHSVKLLGGRTQQVEKSNASSLVKGLLLPTVPPQ